MSRSSDPLREDPPRFLQFPTGSSNLLVVGDRGARCLVVDHERQVWLVKSMPSAEVATTTLRLLASRVLFNGEPCLLVGTTATQPRRCLSIGAGRQVDGVPNGQAVDDTCPLEARDDLGKPGHALPL